MRKILPLLFMFFGFLLVAAAVYFFIAPAPTPQATITAFPDSIIGIPLSQHIYGAEAIDSINQLHGKDFPLEDGVVAVYGDQDATLWVSVAADENAALELTNLMVERIAEGNSPFEDKGPLDFGGTAIYYLQGLGQNHYYWQSGNLVLWLAVDEEFAGDALTEVLAFYR